MTSEPFRKPVRKAVFPVAGQGTRFLPATKAIPKEMLPIIDRPLIQYAIDEAREAGIEEFIFVTGRGKTSIVEHFDTAFELEATMTERKKDTSVLDSSRMEPGSLLTVRQQVPLGLGHAVWCARAFVGDEPFAIFLPDELMVGAPGGTGCMKQMVEAYAKVGGNLVSVLEVPHEEVSSYGVIAPGAQDGALTEVKGLVEKPKAAEAPSNLIVSGRYILQPEVMAPARQAGSRRGQRGAVDRRDGQANRRAAVPRGDFRGPSFRLRLEGRLCRGDAGACARTAGHGRRGARDRKETARLR